MQDGLAACGGVVRNHEGQFISMYAGNPGSCSIMHADLWGIVLGMQLACCLGIARIVVESDSLSVVHFIQHGWLDLHPRASLLSEIQLLIFSTKVF